MDTTPEQDEKINAWFHKWKPQCSVCGSKKWAVNATMVSMSSISAADPSEIIRKHLPIVLFVCETCSNTLSVGAVAAGFIDEDV